MVGQIETVPGFQEALFLRNVLTLFDQRSKELSGYFGQTTEIAYRHRKTASALSSLIRQPQDYDRFIFAALMHLPVREDRLALQFYYGIDPQPAYEAVGCMLLNYTTEYPVSVMNAGFTARDALIRVERGGLQLCNMVPIVLFRRPIDPQFIQAETGF